MLLAGSLALAGCAAAPSIAPPHTPSTTPQHQQWSGRLALQLENGVATSQSFFATFELVGNAERGHLRLLGPVGSTLAELDWQPNQAHLYTAENRAAQTAPSLDALLEQATGTPIPVAALFDWLHGRHTTQAAGWQADLSQLDQGRIVAVRATPPPQATLRVALDRD